MRKPYLLQRMKHKIHDVKPGFDGRFDGDYMGSSEFEFGALPKSLKVICAGWKKAHIIEAVPTVKAKDGRILFIMGIGTDAHEYQAFIPDLVADRMHLKEWSGIPESLGLNHTGMCWQIKAKFDMWWDIDNNVMLLLGNRVVEALKLAIPEVIEKKRAEGKSEWIPAT